MPIYEYYCPQCDARFSHLVRRFDAPPPACPGCGSLHARKLISPARRARSDTELRVDWQARSRRIDPDDVRETARFLQQGGSLTDEAAPVEREAFREILARRADGAGDDDLAEVSGAIPLRQPEQAHPPHDHGPDEDKQERHAHGARHARHVGWA